MDDDLAPYVRWHDLPLRIVYCTHGEPVENHTHTFYELVLVREGAADHFMNGEHVPVRAGNIFLIPPGKVHSYRNTEHFGIYNILFTEEILRTFKHDLSNTANYQMLFHLQPELCSNLRAKTDMLTVQRGDFTEAGSRTAALGKFLHLIVHLIRNARVTHSHENRSCVYQISRLLAEMDRDPAKAWTLENMATFVGMSQSSFRQQFRAMTGKAPVAYLLQSRLQKAAMMLKLSDPVSETAFRLGFKDSNYFTRQFHAFYGISPREYRKQKR